MKDGGAVIIFALFYSYIWSGTSGTNVNDNDPAFLQTVPLRFFTMQEQHCQPSVAKCQHIMSEAEQLQVASIISPVTRHHSPVMVFTIDWAYTLPRKSFGWFTLLPVIW